VTAVHADGSLRERSSGARSSGALRPAFLPRWENQRVLSSGFVQRTFNVPYVEYGKITYAYYTYVRFTSRVYA